MSTDGLRRFDLGDVIGLAPIPGETCDAVNATVMPMPDGATRQDGDPGGRTEQGGAYLWDGWWEQKLAEIQAARAAGIKGKS